MTYQTSAVAGQKCLKNTHFPYERAHSLANCVFRIVVRAGHDTVPHTWRIYILDRPPDLGYLNESTLGLGVCGLPFLRAFCSAILSSSNSIVYSWHIRWGICSNLGLQDGTSEPLCSGFFLRTDVGLLDPNDLASVVGARLSLTVREAW